MVREEERWRRLLVLTWVAAARSSQLHVKPFVLLVLVFCGNLFFAALAWTKATDSSHALLLSFECFNTFVETTHTLSKYLVFSIGTARVRGGKSPPRSHRLRVAPDARRFDGNWDDRGHYLYYLEFSSDSLILTATFLHYIHLLYTFGVSFTLIDVRTRKRAIRLSCFLSLTARQQVVLLLNLRTVVLSLQRKFAAYRAFVAMERELREKYPTLEGSALAADDVCSICRDAFVSAKQLPCGHLYHLGCIRSWLEQVRPSCAHLFCVFTT